MLISTRKTVCWLAAVTAVFVLVVPWKPAEAGRAARHVTVQGSKTVGLRYYMRFRNRDCKPRKVVVKIIKEPEHGTLIRKKGMRDPYDSGTTTGWGARCTGVKIPTIEFFYRANKGYRGKDHVILRPIGLHSMGVNHHFRITVE